MTIHGADSELCRSAPTRQRSLVRSAGSAPPETSIFVARLQLNTGGRRSFLDAFDPCNSQAIQERFGIGGKAPESAE